MNVKAYVIFLVLIFLGTGLGYVLAYVVTTQPILAPANHYAVAQSIIVSDASTSETLKLHYMGGVFSISMPSLNEFPPGHTYQYSRWELDSDNGGVQAFMVIAGPGVDGSTYGVEISRKCWDALQITIPGHQPFSFPAVTSIGTVSPGYLSFEYVP